MKKIVLLLGFALSITMNAQVTADVEHSFGSFNGDGFNGSVNSITLQSDQKFIVGGDFTSFNSQTVNRLLRYNSDCTIDNNFNIGTGFDNSVTSVAIQTDGKIIVGGDFTSYNGTTKNKIVRLNSNGSIDTNFLIGIGFNNSVKKIIVQPDGKILVGGYFTSYNGTTQNALVRLNANGSVDETFVSSLGSGSQTNDIALQSDGKILAGGGSLGFLKRLNIDGTLDISFSYVTYCHEIHKIAIQQDGTIWVGGKFVNIVAAGSGWNTNINLGLVKITPNGTIVPVPFFTPSNTNSSSLNCVGSRTVSLLSIQPDGKIYISSNQSVANTNPFGGSPIYSYSKASGRFNSDGSVDFMYTNLIGGDINAVAVQPDGKILIGGNYTSYNNNTNNAILLRLYGSTETGGFCQSMSFSNLSNMPSSRGLIASATDGSNIYVCNGFSPTVNYTTQIEKYNTATNAWSTFSNTNAGLRYGSAEVVGNKLYVFNGIPDTTTFNNKMEVIDLTTGVVTYSTNNPSPVRSAGSSVWNGKIYSFGGTGSTGNSNKLYVFDPVLQTWTALANMPQAKEAKGEIINGKLYVIGGFNSAFPAYSTSIDCYDIQTNTWTHLMDMPAANSANATSAYQNKIWVVGDYNNLTFVGYYDVLTNQFVSIQSNIIGRRHASTIALNNNLYAFGGNQTSFADSCLNSLQVANFADFTSVPNVGYVTPQTYAIGTAISPLTPINTSGSCGLIYSITPALPSGLTLDTATGIISGTPVGTSPVTSYSITACNSFVCITSTLVLSTTTLGTTEFSTTSLKLYPNPTQSLLNIQTSTGVVLDKITITDLTGKIVMEQTQNTNQVSVEKLATGVYILNGYSEGSKFQEKFIKQ
ncbi:MAG: Kelch repeat-containing protein [Flavobacterium sp.]